MEMIVSLISGPLEARALRALWVSPWRSSFHAISVNMAYLY
jgi:hypothetical protein